jgi:hypothetical protein
MPRNHSLQGGGISDSAPISPHDSSPSLPWIHEDEAEGKEGAFVDHLLDPRTMDYLAAFAEQAGGSAGGSATGSAAGGGGRGGGGGGDGDGNLGIV